VAIRAATVRTVRNVQPRLDQPAIRQKIFAQPQRMRTPAMPSRDSWEDGRSYPAVRSWIPKRRAENPFCCHIPKSRLKPGLALPEAGKRHLAGRHNAACTATTRMKPTLPFSVPLGFTSRGNIRSTGVLVPAGFYQSSPSFPALAVVRPRRDVPSPILPTRTNCVPP